MNLIKINESHTSGHKCVRDYSDSIQKNQLPIQPVLRDGGAIVASILNPNITIVVIKLKDLSMFCPYFPKATLLNSLSHP